MYFEHAERYSISEKKTTTDDNPEQLCLRIDDHGDFAIQDGLGNIISDRSDADADIIKSIESEKSEVRAILPDFVDDLLTDDQLDAVDALVDKTGASFSLAKRMLGFQCSDGGRNEEYPTPEQDRIDAQIMSEAIKYYSRSSTTNGQLECILSGHPMAHAFDKKTPSELEGIAERQRMAGDERLRRIIGSNVLRMLGFNIDDVDENGQKVFKSENDLIGALHDKYYPGHSSNEVKSERAKLRRKLNKIIAKK